MFTPANKTKGEQKRKETNKKAEVYSLHWWIRTTPTHQAHPGKGWKRNKKPRVYVRRIVRPEDFIRRTDRRRPVTYRTVFPSCDMPRIPKRAQHQTRSICTPIGNKLFYVRIRLPTHKPSCTRQSPLYTVKVTWTIDSLSSDVSSTNLIRRIRKRRQYFYLRVQRFHLWWQISRGEKRTEHRIPNILTSRHSVFTHCFVHQVHLIL
jgi:hypothetical protein